MWNSHFEKFGGSEEKAVEINEVWVIVNICKCGNVHTYTILTGEPSANLPRLNASELSDEMRNHLTEKVFQEKLVLAVK